MAQLFTGHKLTGLKLVVPLVLLNAFLLLFVLNLRGFVPLGSAHLEATNNLVGITTSSSDTTKKAPAAIYDSEEANSITSSAQSSAPAVVSSEPAPVPAPVAAVTRPGQAVGLSVADDLPGLSQVELNARFSDMNTLGVTWVRLDFDWSWIQADRNQPIDWTKIDRVVETANRHHLQLLPILVYTPAWARPAGCDSNRCPPKNPEDFANFARLAVARYAPLGVHHWEIWNEPNMRGSWLPAANPYEYHDLLAATYGAIKGADPSALVLTGGLGPVATGNGSIQALEYLQELYDAGTRPYFDAVSFHPYSFPVLPSNAQAWNAWQQMSDTKHSFRSIMIAHGDSGKDIWITEYGAPTGGPNNASHAVSESFQAQTLVDALTQINKHSGAGPLFWYSYKDYNSADNATIENHFGIIRSDGSKKPAYYQLKQLLNP